MEPHSAEGVLAARMAFSPGMFQRAGQAGIITGFDWTALAGLMPADVDRDRVIALLQVMEQGVLEGAREAAAMMEKRQKMQDEFARER